MKTKLFSFTLIVILCINLLNTVSPASAQQAVDPVTLVRVIELESTGIRSPFGFTFSKDKNAFIVFDQASAQSKNIVLTSVKLFEEEAFESLAVGLSTNSFDRFIYDPLLQTAYSFDNASKRITRTQLTNGVWSPPQTVAIDQLGIASVNAVAVNQVTGSLEILDPEKSQIAIINDSVFISEGKQLSLNKKAVSDVNLGQVKGFTIHPQTGHQFLLTEKPSRIIELSASTKVEKAWDTSTLRLTDPVSITFSPTGDPTDDPNNLSLNILDAGISKDLTAGTTAKINEVSLEALVVAPLAVTLPAAIVRSVALSAWNPPSPDSSGIAFWPSTGGLLISDSEVDGVPAIFTGKNVYTSTLTGILTGTCTTMAFTSEPTGAAINPVNNHIFYSSDDAGRVYEVNLGPDQLYCTADDSITSISTRLFNSYDPEGIAFGEGKLIIADGVGREVYIVSPGNNGLFDGISPSGDDTVSQFDTYVYGMNDPEGIEYNPDRGTINIVGNYAVKAILETDFNGNLISSFDLTSLPTSVRSGLAYGPASNGGNEKHFYLVSRGVDNGTDPNENDGMLYEINTFQSGATSTPTNSPTGTLTPASTATFTSTPPGTPTHTFTPLPTSTFTFTPTVTSLPNSAPVVDAGENQSVILPGVAVLDGTVTDDGRPDPPHLLTTNWSIVSGPGIVAFGDPSMIDTTASFSQAGTYVLQLSASDGFLSSTDSLIVVVMSVGAISTFEKRIAAGNDDAEESPAGAVNRSSSDIELVYNAGNQTVGLYFSNINVPPGVTITNAYIQFKAAKKTSEATSLVIRAQANATPASFSATAFNISSRPRLTSSATWVPVAWTVTNESGVKQRTSNLNGVVQEIVNQAGWKIGNPAVLIITGSGKRVAKSFNNDAAGAALLHVEFQPSETVQTPTAIFTQTHTATVTSTHTPTPTATFTSTPINSATPTLVESPTFTNTPVFSDTPTPTSTASNTPTMTFTFTPTLSQTTPPPLNQAPVVNAGVDQTVVLPSSILLDGSVSDDGLPVIPGNLTTTWSQVAGAGSVTFGNANMVDTSAQFSTTGTYVLKLSVFDGEFTTSDEITIMVGQVKTYEVRIIDPNDEAEEFASGWVYRTSSDLELVYDSSLQTVGLRFRSLPIPKGSMITNAYIQFRVDSATSELTSLLIKAQAADNPTSFTSTAYNVSTRPVGTAAVTWDPVPWLTVGDAGLNQRTPDLSSLVAEVVNRSGWTPLNSMVVIITGSGKRVATAYYGSAAGAPLFHIEYIDYQ